MLHEIVRNFTHADYKREMIHILSHDKQSEPPYKTLSQIKSWIVRHIHRPIQGFEHKKNPDGTWYTKEQQLHATRFQALNVAHYFINRGKSFDEIVNVLSLFR